MSAFAPVGNGLVLCYVVARPNERLAYVRGSNVVRLISGESETRVAAIGDEIEVAARGDGWPLEFDPPPLGGATRAAIVERIAELGDRGAIADVYARSVLVIAQHQTRAGGFLAPDGQDVLLAHALDMHVKTPYLDKDYCKLGDELLDPGKDYSNENILICWHHGEILNLANLLLTKNPSSDLPTKWPGDVFGWLLWISYDAEEKPTVTIYR